MKEIIIDLSQQHLLVIQVCVKHILVCYEDFCGVVVSKGDPRNFSVSTTKCLSKPIARFTTV